MTITDLKIDWLAKHGYVVKHQDGDTVSYSVTEKGKKYLNGTV